MRQREECIGNSGQLVVRLARRARDEEFDALVHGAVDVRELELDAEQRGSQRQRLGSPKSMRLHTTLRSRGRVCQPFGGWMSFRISAAFDGSDRPANVVSQSGRRPKISAA